MSSADEESRLPLLPPDKEGLVQVPAFFSNQRLAVFAALWLALGVYAGMQIEGWHFLSSLYVFTQIVTSIGYGDITVTTQAMKLFMTFYVMICVLIVASFLSNLTELLLQKESSAFTNHLDSIKKNVEQTDPNGSAQQPDAMLISSRKPEVEALIKSFVTFLSFVIFGTVFYTLYESCSCSYGMTAIHGCVEGPKCEETGGAVKNYVDSLYMSVITLTTVGFGDHTPKTKIGRTVGIVWMLVGVVVTANFVSDFSKVFLSARNMFASQSRMSMDLFQSIDDDNSGFLSCEEFRMFALLKYAIVDQQQLDAIDSLFHAMDQSGDGKVTYEELTLHCGN